MGAERPESLVFFESVIVDRYTDITSEELTEHGCAFNYLVYISTLIDISIVMTP